MRELKLVRNVEEGKAILSSLNDIMSKYSAKRINYLLDTSRYTAFLNFPREVRHYIYTNNTSESFNPYLDVVRQDLGGYFPSSQLLDTYVVAIIRNNSCWKSSPVSHIRHHSYHLKRLHASRFQVMDDEGL
ncbi:MAG: transposase [Metallosphaera sp.]